MMSVGADTWVGPYNEFETPTRFYGEDSDAQH